MKRVDIPPPDRARRRRDALTLDELLEDDAAAARDAARAARAVHSPTRAFDPYAARRTWTGAR